MNLASFFVRFVEFVNKHGTATEINYNDDKYVFNIKLVLLSFSFSSSKVVKQ